MKLTRPGDHFEIVKRPLLTEKAVALQERNNCYGFEVHRDANKIQIRLAVEKLFNVKVAKVRTINVRGKARRLGWRAGHKPDWKKAIVTLKEGHKIEVI